MSRRNQTVVTEFLLLGFGNLDGLRVILFVLCLLVYVMTLLGNITIIMLVSTSQLLHSPMYFFLCHLSFSDMMLTTDIVPNLLHIILEGGRTMPFLECIVQFQLFGASTGTECLLLTVMSYDRYLAICNPLSYVTVMGTRLKRHLVAWSWVLSFVITLTVAILMSNLHFCGPNIIDHFFCDYVPILRLSCSDTRLLQVVDLVLTAPVTLLPFILIIISYICISIEIVKIPTGNGRQKAFSTCSSHLTVVCIFYLSLIAIYLIPSSGNSVTALKIISLMYTVITPFLNPLIYSLRNQEIKATFMRLVLLQV
ncbi:PREDICTED: olfactory receptor 5G3-like [Nanorana parkeri]|uniref:olfactory receptor 5G3-like n=1 Tax=Nanorana parkeri TaxID=125878 RepID=UPI000854D979|nr:PREDICTED: olfactory receptor 5G3-like [Nanorana parkeri]